jgi:hypothetical protein
MKPLVRWVIGGNYSKAGERCLRLSIKQWKKLYGDSFDYVVCYNGRKPKVNIETVCQDPNALPFEPSGPAWKLYPPRLRRSSHEIIIDNDIIFHKRLPQIDQFLSYSNFFLATQGVGVRSHEYGSFSGFANLQDAPGKRHINSGFIGLPPGFRYKDKIMEVFKKYSFDGWGGHFDEQGLVASIVTENNYILIPLEDVSVSIHELHIGRCGIHFCGLNSGPTKAWKQYLINKTI